MIKLISSVLILVGLFSCAHADLKQSNDASEKKQSLDINQYIYLETRTGIYNSMKATQEQLRKKQTAKAVTKLNQLKDIEYHESLEEKIEKKASVYMAQGKWRSAFDILIQYEPVLTHNKNLTNQIIYTAIKIENYDYAIDQLQLALSQNDEVKAVIETRQEKEIILAHVYYLSQKYDLAATLYTKLLIQDNFQEANKYLFLVGYKLKNLDVMRSHLAALGESHKDFIDFNFLTAKVESAEGQTVQAENRLARLFNLYPENQEVVLEYSNTLIKSEKYKEALSVLDQSGGQISEARQYHFMKAYISHHLGDKTTFRRELASTQVEGRYDKLLTQLFLQKHKYNDVYSTIFRLEEMDEFKLIYLVKEEAEKFTSKYMNKPQFKDAILVREEFRSVTEPIRLPASLEFKPAE